MKATNLKQPAMVAKYRSYGTCRTGSVKRGFFAILMLAALSIRAAGEEPTIPVAAGQLADVPFHGGKLEDESTGETALIASRDQMLEYLKRGRCAGELRAFFEKTDFKSEALLIYNFTHMGSGSDRPACAVTYANKEIVIRIYDKNQNDWRTSDLRVTTHHLALSCNKRRVARIIVRDAMGLSPGRTFHLDLPGANEVDKAVNLVQGFPKYADWDKTKIRQVKELDFEHYDLSVEEFRVLGALPDLERLILGGANAHPEKLALLRDYPRLKSLYLGVGRTSMLESLVDDACLAALPTTLKSLDLSNASLSDDGLGMIRKMVGLEDLVAMNLQKEGKAPRPLEVVAELPNLRSLNLKGNRLTPGLFEKLGKIELRSLKIDGFRWSKERSAASVAEERNLEQCLKGLQEMMSLKRLDFRCAMLSDKHLDSLTRLRGLTHLEIAGYNEVTDDGMRYLKRLSGLQSLSIGYTKVGDAGLRHLDGLPLKRLDLRSTSVSDNGLDWIAERFPDLEDLNLRYAKNVTKNGAAAILKMKALKRINAFASFKGLRNDEAKAAFGHLKLYNDDMAFIGDEGDE